MWSLTESTRHSKTPKIRPKEGLDQTSRDISNIQNLSNITNCKTHQATQFDTNSMETPTIPPNHNDISHNEPKKYTPLAKPKPTYQPLSPPFSPTKCL